MKYKTIVFLILCILFVTSPRVRAQLTPEGAINEIAQTLTITITPENPGPDENVTITAESFSTDLDQANITWTVQDKVIKKGVGEKQISFTTGSIGSNTTIKLQISPIDGKPFTKTIVISPNTVDLMWQSLAYTPPFYKGRSLLSHQGSVVFLAIPAITNSKGQLSDPKQMVYTWSKNGKVLGSLSGYGKNTLYIDNSLLGLPLTVSISVSSSGSDTKATNSVHIESIEPRVLLYQNSPLYGVLYNNALLSNFKLLNKEITITGVPLYFSTRDLGTAIRYNWALNNTNVEAGNRNFITLRKENDSGSSALSLIIENSNKLLQSAEMQSLIKFGDQTDL